MSSHAAAVAERSRRDHRPRRAALTLGRRRALCRVDRCCCARSCARPAIRRSAASCRTATAVVRRRGRVRSARCASCDRPTLYAFLRMPELGFGEGYTDGSIEVDGDLLEVVDAAYRKPPSAADRAPLLLAPSGRAPTRCAARAQHPPALRPRQRLLPPVARRAHALHLRVLPDARGDARGGPGREDAPRLPQGGAAPRRAGGRSRLRLGRAGAAHGAPLRRHRPRLQHLARADRLRPRAGGAAGPERPRRVHRGRLPQHHRHVRLLHVGRHARARRRPTTTASSARVIDRCLPAHGRGLIHTIGRTRPTQPERLDREAHLPGRPSADAARDDATSSSPSTSRCSTSRTCACTTSRRRGTGCSASSSTPTTCSACSTSASCAPGASISPAPSVGLPHSACCSSSRSSSRATASTGFRGRGRRCTRMRRAEVRVRA